MNSPFKPFKNFLNLLKISACVATRYVLYICSHRTTEQQSFVSWVCDRHLIGEGLEAPRGEIPGHLVNDGGEI